MKRFRNALRVGFLIATAPITVPLFFIWLTAKCVDSTIEWLASIPWPDWMGFE